MRFPFFLLIISLFLTLSSGRTLAQTTLSLSLRDATTDAPVEDAFVFFSGSSAGGITDAEGKVELVVAEYLELVVSHLNYETKVLSVAEVQALTSSVILLTPTAIKIAEVTVSSSAKDAKKRNRRLKTFTRSLLGPKQDRKGVRITNPEVLLFEEDEDGLRAIARDRIKISNDALGYELSFLLDTFLVTREEEVFYGGKAFFADLAKTQPARAAAWQTARRKRFADSKTYFFRQLVRGEVNDQRFDFGRTAFDKDLKFLGFTRTNPSSLRWQRGLRADTLYFSGYLTVVDQRVVTKWTNQSAAGGVVADEYATSFLQSRSGKFVISPDGILLNNQEVEELGYWADQRVARLLPTDYRADEEAGERQSLMVQSLDALEAFQRDYRQEKVYLHLDKPYYSIRDNIWFKAYLLDAVRHQEQTASSVVHVELIDPKGDRVKALALNRVQALYGNFKLDSTNQAGIYHLRAYTDYMRNGPSDFFFSRAIPIYDPSQIGDGKLKGVSLRPQQVPPAKRLQQPFVLKAIPESGVLLGGLQNSLVMHLRDTLGNPLRAAGTIMDIADSVVAKWSVDDSGRGILKFSPEGGKPYWAALDIAGVSYRVRLPEVVEKGMGLHVNNLRKDDVFVKVLATAGTATEGAYLIGHVRGKVFFSMESIAVNEDMAFPRSQIPAGVACFSLFSRSGKLLAERVLYNDFSEEQPALEVTVPYAFFRPRQRVNLEVSWLDSLTEQGGNFSVAVTDRRLIKQADATTNAPSFVYLQSDIVPPLELPQNRALNWEQRERFLLDLQLMSTTWDRFTWEEVLFDRERQLAFLPETSARIRGFVSSKGKEAERQMSEVMLTALHPRPTLMKVLTDEAGNFEFPGLPYLDTVSYLLQAARFDAKKFDPDLPMLTSKKRNVDIHVEQREPAELVKHPEALTMTLPEELVETLATLGAQNLGLDSLYGPGWQIDLAEVTVKARKAVDSRNLDVYDLNKLDWIQPEQPVYNLLSTLKPGYRFLRDLTRNQLTAEVNDGKGSIVRRPVVISIDGSTASFGRFLGLKADLIDYIMITRTSITIRTRDQPRSGSTLEQPGILTTQTYGYYPEVAFPAPDYAVNTPGTTRPDLRTTIHWEPNFRVEAGKPSWLSFYAADIPTEYEVHIEGITDDGIPVLKTFVVTIAE